ncbi:30S ribosomal protein S17 [Desulfonatronum thiosulfatophilum]|uniref:Small ribosomal subunit protein uS17 n=1 Tax=Desulfonatronum thiosulfatophilum TaxID=617002 RepID=A0A1G6BMC1_9BACT|nr:30S ribosomal protein S17 [Desulfonatronum thiosulfatophilum]SDB21758.1 small subunit ribosomal protein S17 [Desulfonatronum thiosulfatophilum]
MNTELKQKTKRTEIGVVMSNKAEKTIVVSVNKLEKHPLFKKYIRRRKKMMAHDEQNVCNIGDKVEIIESRPLSKRKCWQLKQVLERAV